MQEATFQSIEVALRKAGVNPTSQRLAIGKFLLEEANHPTAEDVKKWADDNLPKISLATVYNTLHTLSAAGLIREYRLPHTDKVIYDRKTDDHCHLVMEDGEIIDLDKRRVSIDSHLFEHFDVENVEITLYGKRREKKTG